MRNVLTVCLLLLAACKPAERPAPPAQPEPSASVSAPIPQRFQALGTEPFWSVEVRPGQLRYSSPENIDGTGFAATETGADGGTRWSGTLEGKPFSLLIVPGQCSDGMSDTVYAWKATLRWGEVSEQGCARER